MTDGPALVHNPLASGLYRSVVPRGDEVDHGRWMRACAEGSFVGECRHCGGYLRPRHPEEHGGRTEYEATCVTCSAGVLAPNARTLRRSSRHTEQPGGWWDARTHRLKNAGGAT